MMKIHPEAEQLNLRLNSVVLKMLSEKGKRLFSPKNGILKQAGEAKEVKFNATIGIALADDKSPLGLPSLVKWLPDKTSLPYAPGMGLLELRKIWQEKMLEKNSSLKLENISLPVVTSGLSHGVFITGVLFADQEDELLLPDKFWENYRMLLEVSVGAKLSLFNTFSGNGLDLESLKQSLKTQTGKTVLILNFPNNPSGYSPTKPEADEIISILTQHAETHETVVICDDAYWGLVYEEGIEKESLFAKLSNAHENLLAVKLDGATKEDFAWGLRVGFITFGKKGMTPEMAEALENKVAAAIRSQISMACHPSQMAVLRALKSPTYDAEKQVNFDILQIRYQAVRDILDKNKDRYEKYFSPIPFNAGYFMCVELIPELNASELREKLIQDFDTGVIVNENMLRIAFSCVKESDISTLFENIYKACEVSALENVKCKR